MDKKIVIKFSVGAIIILVLVLGVILYKLNENCTGEGGSIFSEDNSRCCMGLKVIPMIDDNGGPWMDTALCTKCGDGICKQPENKYNCPKDCKK